MCIQIEEKVGICLIHTHADRVSDQHVREIYGRTNLERDAFSPPISFPPFGLLRILQAFAVKGEGKKSYPFLCSFLAAEFACTNFPPPRLWR